MKAQKTISISSRRPFDKIYLKDTSGNILYFRGLSVPLTSWRFNVAFPSGKKAILTVSKNGVIIPHRIKVNRLKKYSSSFIKLPKYDHYLPSKKIYFDHKTEQLAYNHLGRAIYFGSKIYSLPYFLRPFVLFHEQGHNYYLEEENADLFAIKQMLDAGANPSDIVYALEEGLVESDLKKGRLKQAFNYLQRL